MTYLMGLPLLVLINVATALKFADDKRRAIRGARRVPESDLLFCAAIGGSPAAFWARRRFRHKTRKEPFSTRLQLIAVIQVGALIGVASALL